MLSLVFSTNSMFHFFLSFTFSFGLGTMECVVFSEYISIYRYVIKSLVAREQFQIIQLLFPIFF